jgi:hypothetical protein
MALEITKPEHFVEFTRTQLKDFIKAYVEKETGRKVRSVGLHLDMSGEREIAARVFLESEK